MRMNDSVKFRSALFIILITFLFIPLFESSTDIVKVKNLDGAFLKNGSLSILNADNWFDETYQFSEEVRHQ